MPHGQDADSCQDQESQQRHQRSRAVGARRVLLEEHSEVCTLCLFIAGFSNVEVLPARVAIMAIPPFLEQAYVQQSAVDIFRLK